MNNALSSISIYWMFVLRLIGRNDVSKWSDSLIENGIYNELLFDLSTCSQMDDNEILDKIKHLNYNSDLPNKVFNIDILMALRKYYSELDNGPRVNLSLLMDFEMIDQLLPEVRHGIAWLFDDIGLSREGLIDSCGNESKFIIIKIDKLISAQQGDAPETGSSE